MNAPGDAIVIEALTKRYGNTLALDCVNLRLRTGSVVAVMGRNGAGKSTLVNILAGLAVPSAGKVTVMGREISGHDVAHLRQVGVMPSPLCLLDLLTCEEQIAFTLQAHGQHGMSLASRMAVLLQYVGLVHDRAKLVGELSKGSRKRLGLALALANDPDVVILDEPFADIDPIAGQALACSLADSYRRPHRTAVVVTHDPTFAARYCTQVVVLEAGRVKATQPIEHDSGDIASRATAIVEQLSKT